MDQNDHYLKYSLSVSIIESQNAVTLGTKAECTFGHPDVGFYICNVLRSDKSGSSIFLSELGIGKHRYNPGFTH